MECTNKLLLNINGRKQIVPCGKCVACRIHKTTEWTTRLLFELPYWNYKAVFLTLTYDNLHLPSDYGLNKRDFQLFMKLLRKDLELENRKIKYYMCGEYGDLYGRPHYHAIVFGLDPCSEHDRQLVKDNWEKCDSNRFNGANNGFAFVTADSINYVTGYIQKKLSGPMAEDKYQGRQAPFSLMSKGLGLQYFVDNRDEILQNGCVHRNGVELSIPRYYVKKFDIKTDTNKCLTERLKFLEEKGYDTTSLSMFGSSVPSDNINIAYWIETMTSSAIYGEWLQKKFNME